MEGEGEKLSKNEQKRIAKAAQKAKEKAEKQAKAAEAAPEKSAGAKAKSPEKAVDPLSGEEITPNEYFKLRSKAVEDLKSDPQTHPYPHKFHVTISLTEFIAKYADTLEDGQALDDVELSVAGRVHAIRESGAKLLFYDLR